jgi:hypothetical protein
MAEVETPVAPPETPPTVDPPAPVAEETPSPAAAESVEELPAWAQKLITKTRSEAASNRAKASEQAQALESTRDAIAQALGLKDDSDPVKAAQTAAEERDAARQEARQTRIENAVLRSAGKHGADPEALTDSRSFMHALEAIDPAADDFGAQVDAAIVNALNANANLKLTPAAPPARSGGPVGGGTPVAGQLSRDDLKDMTPDEIAKAKEDGRLNQVLGIV